MAKDSEGVRLIAEPPSKNPLSKEAAKKILIDKIRVEFNNEKKLAGFQVTSAQAAIALQSAVALERTRAMDMIYIKYKVKFADLQRAMVEFDLENDDDVKKTRLVGKATK